MHHLFIFTNSRQFYVSDNSVFETLSQPLIIKAFRDDKKTTLCVHNRIPLSRFSCPNIHND